MQEAAGKGRHPVVIAIITYRLEKHRFCCLSRQAESDECKAKSRAGFDWTRQAAPLMQQENDRTANGDGAPCRTSAPRLPGEGQSPPLLLTAAGWGPVKGGFQLGRNPVPEPPQTKRLHLDLCADEAVCAPCDAHAPGRLDLEALPVDPEKAGERHRGDSYAVFVVEFGQFPGCQDRDPRRIFPSHP